MTNIKSQHHIDVDCVDSYFVYRYIIETCSLPGKYDNDIPYFRYYTANNVKYHCIDCGRFVEQIREMMSREDQKNYEVSASGFLVSPTLQ